MLNTSNTTDKVHHYAHNRYAQNISDMSILWLIRQSEHRQQRFKIRNISYHAK